MKINDEAREQLMQIVDHLSDKEINQKPSDHEWSIKQILEHLFLMEGGITQTIAKQLASGNVNEVSDKPIELSVNRSTKVQAPDFAIPTDEFVPLAKLKEQLLYTHEQLQQFTERTTTAELEEKSYPHPVFGEMNLKQWVTFIAYHEMRHTEQIREVKEKLGFS